MSISSSNNAMAEMYDGESSADFDHSQLISFFQSNMTGVRCERLFGCMPLTENCVASISSVS